MSHHYIKVPGKAEPVKVRITRAEVLANLGFIASTKPPKVDKPPARP